MNFRVLANKVAPVVRSIHTSSVVRSDHDTRGIVGSNLPFPIHNRYLLLGIFIVYFSSGLAVPFLAARHVILSKNVQ